MSLALWEWLGLRDEHPAHNQELKWERDDEIGRAVSYIRENFRSNLEIANLVDVSGLNGKLHRGLLSSLEKN